MKHSYYSILFAVISPSTNERVSVGLLLSSENHIHYKWSQQKLAVIQKLLPREKHKLIQFSLKQIDETVNLKNEESERIFAGSPDYVFSKEYLNYLSTYNQNTLQISSPDIIEAEPSEDVFDLLYDKYVYRDKTEKEQPKNEKLDRFKMSLYPKIQSRVNTDFTITSDRLEKLIVPVEVNFIGKNGSPVTGKFIDFDKRIDLVQNEISDYVSLIKSFDLMNQRGKYFTIADEPSKVNPKNHNLWSHLRDINITEFVTTDGTDMISDYIIEKDVVPYFKELVEQKNAGSNFINRK